MRDVDEAFLSFKKWFSKHESLRTNATDFEVVFRAVYERSKLDLAKLESKLSINLEEEFSLASEELESNPNTLHTDSKAGNKNAINLARVAHSALFLIDASLSGKLPVNKEDEEKTRLSNCAAFVNLIMVALKAIGSAQALLDVKQLERELCSEYAKLRHVETYSLKNQALEYWRENIDSKLSADKAATILQTIVPVSHRKLAEYVSQAKKELRSTGRA